MKFKDFEIRPTCFLEDHIDPCSQVLELTSRDGVVVHTPPNRALIPTGRFVDVAKMIKHAIGEET